jgi:hypothetical protein
MNELANYFRSVRSLSQAQVDERTREHDTESHPVTERRTYTEQ